MKQHKRRLRLKAFTLIELLTVIAIIAVLAGLLFPAIQSALKKAEVVQAKTEIKAIEAAVKAYYTEYGKLPVQDADQGDCDRFYAESTGTDKQRDIIDTLRAIGNVAGRPNFNDALNPRRIVFLETSSRKGAIDSTGTFYDPWGAPYYTKLDNNYNNLIEYYTGGCPSGEAPCATCVNEKIPGIVVVVSKGPNGTQQDPAVKGSDDIVNYR